MGLKNMTNPVILAELTPVQAEIIRDGWEYELLSDLAEKCKLTRVAVKRYGIEKLGLEDATRFRTTNHQAPKSRLKTPVVIPDRLARPAWFDESDMNKRLVSGR